MYVFGLGQGRRCWGEWVTGLGLALPIMEERGICVLCFGFGGVGGLGESRWTAWTRVWEGGVMLCFCVL